MTEHARPAVERRGTLSKDAVLRAAVAVADEGGIGALTMRGLARRLGVEAMSLYHHVADKDEVLDGIVEIVVSEINDRVDDPAVPADGTGWKAVVRQRILTARAVMLAHPWVPGVMESRRTMGRAALRYHDGLARLMREGGCSIDLVHHAMHALGSRAIGFVQELYAAGDAADADDADPEMEAIMLGQMAAEYPFITEIVTAAGHTGEDTLGWCDDQVEFEFGLDLLLDGLERLRLREAQEGAQV